jgi:hypothetical protein
MSDAVKETCCTRCIHRNVCLYKDDYLAIIKAISETYVSTKLPDGRTARKRINNFDFIDDISVTCHYHENRTNPKTVVERSNNL